MTGQVDSAYYAELERRVKAVVRQFERAFPTDQLGVLLDLADHNEPAVAVEMLSWMLVEDGIPVRKAVRDEFRSLVEVMRLSESVWTELQLAEPAD